MQDSVFVAFRRRKTLWTYTLWMVGLTLFHAVLFNPLYLWINSDVLLQETVLPLILNVFSDLFNYLFYWVTFAFLIFAMARFSCGVALGVGGIFLGGMALRYLLDTLGGYVVMGFPILDEFWYAISGIAITLVFDLVLMGIAFLIGWIIFATKRDGMREKSDKAPFFDWMPPTSFWNLKNPVLLMTFALCGWLGAWMIGSRIYFDFMIGAPSGTIDLLWMITYYLSDLATIVIGFLVVQLLLTQRHMSEISSEILYTSPKEGSAS